MLLSQEKINGLCACLFILALAALFYLRYPNLWAGLMLAGGLTMIVRELLMGRMWGIIAAVFVFGIAWACVTYTFYVGVAIPLLATLGALYILVVQIKREQ